ncbi:UV-stimulated scaffold protein A-like protein [Forsythia ovata]|uniref:UV-stimulated scaffold protein A-like protein n=1 Tax=Forsythia ovata TaxID=205694 RepID=A0ABD1SK98_9LAMI
MLKEFIDIMNHIHSVKRKCEELGFSPPKIANDEEEGIWEQGFLESFASGRYVTTFCQSNDCTTASTSNDLRSEDPRFNKKRSNGNGKNHDISGSESDPLRNKLMAEAPVVTWGYFLNNWGSNQDVLANQRGLDLKGHWGRVDYDAVIPAEKIAKLNVQASVHKEDGIDTLKSLHHEYLRTVSARS